MSTPDATESMEPGRVVDHFRVIRRLGRGGMGEVFLARDLKLGRKVALKIVRRKSLGSDEAIRRFLREARITARFNHPHIVTIHAVGETQDGPYVALEYLKGQTLRQRMEEERFSEREVLRVGQAIAEALKEAHAKGVLHRDLKPENILIPQDGRLRVLDFGLARGVITEPAARAARVHRDHSEDSLLTADSQGATGLVGTPRYMAPEQWFGAKVDTAADIWALGTILHELATGRHPYPVLTSGLLSQRVTSTEPVPLILDTMSGSLASLIERCLAKDPTKRPSAAVLLDTLIELARGYLRTTGLQEIPFQGLSPYAERHADCFFGRDLEVAAFLERLREEPVLPVLGPSGAGKSSFVRAGIIPRLHEQGRWIVLRLRPGAHPFTALATRLQRGESSIQRRGSEPRTLTVDGPHDTVVCKDDTTPLGSSTALAEPEDPEDPEALANALRDAPARLGLRLSELAELSSSRVLLFVDQLEEIYTQGASADHASAFVEGLYQAVDDTDTPVRVVFTLRDDFLGRVAAGATSRQVLNRVFVLRRPGNAELRTILEQSVAGVGFQYEDTALVTEMVDELQEEPTSLPLLQMAGSFLWERRDREQRLLRRAAFREMGGVAGALALHADGILEGLSAPQIRLARELFLRLVTPERTRKIVARGPLLEGLPAAANKVLERLITERAVRVRKGREDAELELVHESLIHTWQRLSGWIDGSREERAFLDQVGQAASLWHHRGRRATEVWEDEALGEALRQAARCAVLPPTVGEFLDAGRLRHRHRQRRRRALQLAGVSSLVLVALIALVVGWVLRQKEQTAQSQKRLAQHQRQEAQRQHAAALRESARSALARGALVEARAKVRLAFETSDAPLTRAVWWRLSRHRLHWQKELSAQLHGVSFAPNGRTVAVASADRSVHLFDTETLATRVLRGHRDQVFSVAFSPNEHHLASGTWSGELRLWTLTDGVSKVLQPRGQSIWGVAFSPDGRLLAAGSGDRTLRLWRIPGGEPVATLRGHAGSVRGVAFSPDGRLVASVGTAREVRLWDLKTRTLRATLRGHEGAVRAVAFSPDSRRIATAGYDNTVRLWSVSKHQLVTTLRGHTAPVVQVVYHPDGRRIASSSIDKTVRLWDAATGAPLAVLRKHERTVFGLAFSPDGRFLVSSANDKRLLLWNLKEAQRGERLRGHHGSVYGVDFSPDGKSLATGGGDKMILLWDASQGVPTAQLTGHSSAVYGVVFSPDGKSLASASGDRTVRLWDVGSTSPRRVLRGHQAPVWKVQFSPDGRQLVSASSDRTVRLWNVNTGAPEGTLTGHRSYVYDVDVSPDGRLIASASADKTIRIWDRVTRRQLAVLKGHHSPVWAVRFGRAGRTLYSAGTRKRLLRWSMGASSEKWTATPLPSLPQRTYWFDVHPNNKTLGLPCSDGTVLLRTSTKATERVMRGHRSEVNFLRFSPDGQRVATTSDDGTLRLWDVTTGRPIWRSVLLRPTGDLAQRKRWLPITDRMGSAQVSAKISAWSRAVTSTARRAIVSANRRHGCLATYDSALVVWDLIRDQRRSRHLLAGLRSLLALDDGCVSLAAGVLRLHSPDSTSPRVLARDVGAVSPHGQSLLLFSGRQAKLVDARGTILARYPASPNVTALAMIGDRLALGYGDGAIEITQSRTTGSRTPFGTSGYGFDFENTPASPVEALAAGPPGTLVVGFGNGVFGLWSLTTGAALVTRRLHGPVRWLRVHRGHLYAASTLGQYDVLDLRVFTRPRCALLQDIWRRVAVTWRAGLPMRHGPPRGHACSH